MSKVKIAAIVIGLGCAGACVWGLWGANIYAVFALWLSGVVMGALVARNNPEKVDNLKARAEKGAWG